MRRILPVLLALFAVAIPARAQQTQTKVTGTITDPNNVAYYPATVLACLTPATTNPTVAGASVSTNIGQPYCVGPAQTSSSGIFQLPLYANSVISCNNVACSTQWQFTVTAAGTAPPAGKGTVSFQVTTSITSLTAQDVTAILVTAAPVLLNSGGGGGAVGPGTPTYVSCFNTTTNVNNCPDSITDSGGTVTIPAQVVIGGGAGAASVAYPSGATSGCQTATAGVNILCSDGTNNTFDESLNGGPLAPLGTTQGIYDASTITASDWGVAVNTLATAHPNSTIVIPDSLAGTSSTTINVGSGNLLQFTGKGTFTFCTMSMGTFSKITADNGASLTESGTNCPGVEYVGGSPTLQSSDHPYLRNVRINCNNQTGSVGLTINPVSGGAALYDVENIEITGCLAEAVNIGAMQFSHWRNVHLQQNYLNFYGSSGGSISSNVFDHLSMQSNSSGVNFILANTSSSQDNGGNIFINPQSQNAAVAGMVFIGTGSNLPPQAHIIGYQPELDGTAALTLTFTNSSAVIGATNTLTAGQILEFTTTGALPTNFAANTAYCVLATGLSTSQFEVSATCGGSAITAGSAGSGTQLAYYAAVINGLTIPQSGALYLSNANVILDDANIAEASADPVINIANSSALSLINPSGYASQFGRYVLADSTSTVTVTGQGQFSGEIFNVAGYPDTLTTGRGAMAGAPVSTLDYTVPQAFAGNPLAPAWSSSTGMTSAGTTTDAVYGVVGTGVFAASTGSTSSNRLQLTSIIPSSYTSVTSNYLFSLLIKCSVATNQMSVEASFSGGNMGFVFGNNGRLNLAAGQWTRVVGWAYNVTSGAEADLYIYPGDTAGATCNVTRIEAIAFPSNSNASWGASGTQALSQILKFGAVNPNGNTQLTSTISLPGATSGSTTLAAPAVAGTSTNFAVLSNALKINTSGTGAAQLSFADTTTGFVQSASGVWKFYGSNTDSLAIASGTVRQVGTAGYGWASSTNSSASQDTGIGRGAAGVVTADTGTVGNAAGTFSALNYKANGSAGLSASNLCSATFASVGGIVTACTATSDARLKMNIHPFARGLADVMKLHVATYNWKKEDQKITGLQSLDPTAEQIGFIAQDVKKAIPEAVGTETHDGVDYLSLPQGDRPIVAALVNAIQEQQRQIAKLKADIAEIRKKQK